MHDARLVTARRARAWPNEYARILPETSRALLGFHTMIQMNDFASEPEELAAVERVLRSGRFILGNEVKQLEEVRRNFVAQNSVPASAMEWTPLNLACARWTSAPATKSLPHR